MKKLPALLVFILFLSVTSNAQTLDSLKLSDIEIPEGYTPAKENNCISIQASIFYDNPEMYGMLIGKLKKKEIQSFDHANDKGAILYFEFEDGFKGEGFLGGLLWGGDKPTKEHPEEYYAKGDFLLIWSFKTGSPLTKISKDKVKTILK